MLMLLSQKESDAQLQRELLEEKLNEMQSFIEMQEAIKKNLPEAFAAKTSSARRSTTADAREPTTRR